MSAEGGNSSLWIVLICIAKSECSCWLSEGPSLGFSRLSLEMPRVWRGAKFRPRQGTYHVIFNAPHCLLSQLRPAVRTRRPLWQVQRPSTLSPLVVPALPQRIRQTGNASSLHVQSLKRSAYHPVQSRLYPKETPPNPLNRRLIDASSHIPSEIPGHSLAASASQAWHSNTPRSQSCPAFCFRHAYIQL